MCTLYRFTKIWIFSRTNQSEKFYLTNVTIDLKNITDTDNDYTLNFVCLYNNFVLYLGQKRYIYLENVDQIISNLEKM